MNYYNEIDPQAAAWLRELIRQGLIPAGDVDERSIEDVLPTDLRPYTQCHFFAGIGGWSYALQLAGWPEDEPVWTGSCPCPPFSAAGKGSECPSCGGRDCFAHPLVTAGWVCLDCGDEWRGDTRHLLPEFERLIGQCGPATLFGEQVASKDGRHWLYALRTTLERLGYAVGAADLCAAGVGAPHIRQRLFFGAYDLRSAASAMGDTNPGRREIRNQQQWNRSATGETCSAGELADAEGQRIGSRLRYCESGEVGRAKLTDDQSACGVADTECNEQRQGRGPRGENKTWTEPGAESCGCGEISGMGDTECICPRGDARTSIETEGRPLMRAECDNAGSPSAVSGPLPTNGYWGDVDWLLCRDGKWRPVEPGTFPLAHGLPARVASLRGYGNAISPQAGAAFIESFKEAREECK